MSQVVPRTCHLCEACCGLAITVDGDQVISVRGDPADPLSQGAVCPKGIAIGDLHHDPDRLRGPLRKTDSGWEPMEWDAALDLVAERIRAIQREHGDDAVGLYRGNPSSHILGLMLFGQGLFDALRTRNIYSAISMDVLPHMLVSLWMFGHRLLQPVPDLDRTRFVLILGGNPSVTNSSWMTVPGFTKRARALQDRGGRIVVVDPRKTETARLADQHVPIRPGTDALLLAAMLHVIFDEGLDAPGRLAEFVDGLEAIRAGVLPYSPERVAATTGVPAETVRVLARELARAEQAAVYGRMGVSVQAHGATCQWLIQLLNLVTGNLDRPGGVMFTAPALDPIGRGIMPAGSHGRWTSRVRGLPEFCGELPVATLVDELVTPGPGQIRALVTVAGNPVLSTPDAPRLERALADLDFMVSIDPYLNETTRHADLILPPLSALERDHYDLAFNALAVRNVAKWSPRVLEPPANARDEWQVFASLTRRLARGLRARIAATVKGWLGPRRMLALALWTGRTGVTLKRLEASVHGIDLGPLKPALPERLKTADSRIAAAPPPLIEDLARLEDLLDAELPEGLDLLLIGRRGQRDNNSWMHNLPRLMKGKDRCTLLMHPDDAEARGLTADTRVLLRSERGKIEAPLEISDSVMPGVVSLPHGFGHDGRGTRLSVANKTPGVNANALTDSRKVDPVGGTAVLNGVPVFVGAVG